MFTINKKTIIILLILLFVSVLAYFIISFYAEKRLTQDIKENSKKFVTAWGTFEDESSDEYLNSIKPYMTDELYAGYLEDAATLREMKAKYEGTVDSQINLKNIKVKKEKNNTFVAEVKAARVSKVLKKTEEESITVTWTKDKSWKISDVTSIKGGKD